MNSQSRTAKITGTGRYLPGDPIDSERLSSIMPGRPVDLFEKYFGVKTRHYVLDPQSGERQKILCRDGELRPLTTAEMGVQASHRALEDAGLGTDDIDAIITNSTTPDGLLPPLTLRIQQRLNIAETQLLDLRGGCSAAIQGLNLATMLVESGRARRVLVVSSECTSPHYFKKLREMNDPQFNDVVNGLLFADGASAVVVEDSEDAAARAIAGLQINFTATKSCFSERKPGFSIKNLSSGGIETSHDHRAIRKTLPMAVERGFGELRQGTGFHRQDFDVLIIPQVNQSMLDIVAEDKNAPVPKGLCYFGHETGNVPAAAMFMALDTAKERGRIEPGDRIGILSIETTSWNFAVASLQAHAGAEL